MVISTISAHGRALKHDHVIWEWDAQARISTISAHGRALKLSSKPIAGRRNTISTISAHGRALKPAAADGGSQLLTIFQQFRLTVEH